MKIYGVIPARSGSKGVVDKNIKSLCNYPLIAYSIVASNNCHNIDKTIVTTDSSKYAAISKKFGAEVVMRPSRLATDESLDIDYLLHLCQELKMELEDVIVLLRPTTPSRDIVFLNEKINSIVHNVTLNISARSVYKLNESPFKMFKVNLETSYIIPFMDISIDKTNLPRQNFSDCYCPNGYLDIIKVSTIIQNKKVYAENIIKIETNNVGEIDSQDDFDFIEITLKKNSKNLLEKLKKHENIIDSI